jgi:hypothetical protein
VWILGTDRGDPVHRPGLAGNVSTEVLEPSARDHEVPADPPRRVQCQIAADHNRVATDRAAYVQATADHDGVADRLVLGDRPVPSEHANSVTALLDRRLPGPELRHQRHGFDRVCGLLRRQGIRLRE